MNDSEVEILAKAHGWRKDVGGRCYSASYSPTNFAVRRGDEGWQLTDAGAFRVLVEAKLELLPHNEFWQYKVRTNFPSGSDYWISGYESPHEAVALARLAQLRA